MSLICLQLKGDAEAFAIEAKAKAEAEQMAHKADAWKDYQEAAMVDMILETIPKVILHNLLDFSVKNIISDCNFYFVPPVLSGWVVKAVG